MTLGQNSAGKDLKTRLLYLGIAMCFGLLVLAGRLYRLQITEGEEYAAKSVSNFVRTVRIRADRGMIKDSRGVVLVDNRPSFDVFVTPAFCEKCFTDVLPRLGELLAWDKDTADHASQLVHAGKRRAPFEQVPVRIDLDRDELDAVSAHLLELPGVEVEPIEHRNYHQGPVLSHVIGYMNEIQDNELDRLNDQGAHYELGDYIGRRGVERVFEKELRGVDGERKEVVNARGEAIPALNRLIQGEDRSAPTPGENVVLSIDMRLQEAAEKIFPGVAGAVIAVDVHTGFIKALVSRPGFDPNLLTGRVTQAQMDALAKDPLQPMIFRPTQQRYSPGSTFKVVTALAAMKAGLINGRSLINCPGGYRLGRRVWRCDLETGHGPLNVVDALRVSCDVFFYHLADQLGIDPIAEMGKSLGLGEQTGFTLVPEVPGIMPDEAYHDRVTPGGYTKGMALNTAIGQGDDNVTAMQMAMLYAAIANGGTLFEPQMVQRLETADGKVVKSFEPKVRRQLNFDPKQRKLIIDGLTAVVNEKGGTGYWSRLKDIVVAGKTGTAQVAALGRVRKKEDQLTYWEKSHAWFDAFAPADSPEIAVIVLNEHGGYGANGSAPTATAVIEKYFELKREDEAAAAGVASASGDPGAPSDSGAAHPVPLPARDTGTALVRTSGETH